jgi:DNA-binding transcriptional LysR family regulator
MLIDPFCAAHPLARVGLETSLRSSEVVTLLRRYELDAGIIYLDGQDTDGLLVTPLYEERQVLISSSGLLTGQVDSITWPEAFELPLCLLNQGMRGRQLLDEALAKHDLEVSPQLETDSVAALYAHVATGRWASVVPYPWTRTLRPPAGVRTLALHDPTVQARIVLVTTADVPGPVLARALVEIAGSLHIDEVFGHGSAPLSADTAT